jgi:hypothetical protein
LLSLDDAIPPAAPGYVVSVEPGGRSLVGDPTLDICDATFASESKRVARLAVDYTDTNGRGPSLEIAMYGPGGAALAYSELVNAVNRCPRTYDDAGVAMTNTEVEPRDPSLLSTQLTVVQSAEGILWESTIYQFDGPYLVAVYTDPYTTKAAALETALDAARKAGAQLQRALTGSSQPIISG